VEEATMSAAPTPAAPPAPRKSFWETVLTATPVALTVLATILAGLSSSELTRAQYHRTLAAQDQSKTSDEWAYFQAKKYRSTYSAGTGSQLRLQSTRQPFTPAVLTALTDRATNHLQNLDERLGNLLQESQSSPGDSGKKLQEHLTAYRQGVKERLLAAQAAWPNGAQVVKDAEVQTALQMLESDELPAANGTGKAADAYAALTSDLRSINPAILDAFQAIDTHKSRRELDALCNRISDEQVRQALEVVENHVERFDRAVKPVGQAHERVGKFLDDILQAYAWAREGASDLHREAGEPAPNNKTNPIGEQFQHHLDQLAQNTEAEDAAATRRGADFMAARLRYNARRYDHEAHYNQTSAWLHEIQVNKSSLLSERHRYRSSLFFFGMLAAQAGVTIATITLALRRRSILWTLATLAGLTAVVLGGYVYLFI
jgi:hypothetical protein